MENHSSDIMDALDGKNVLVVDDDENNIIIITHLLKTPFNIKIIPAVNGRIALSILESGVKVDIILMDIMMPIMDGYEAIHKIQQNPDTKDIPIIAVTAKDDSDELDACIDAGARTYIKKPINMKDLLNAMYDFLTK
jgi:CheY-like chemotaxis protein